MEIKLIAKIMKILDRIVEITAIIAGIIVIFLMISVSMEVVLRYFFRHPTIWVTEVAGYGIVYIPFLVAAWVLKRDAHVRMDLVLSHLSPKNQCLLNAITFFAGAIICFILTYFGVKATLYYVGHFTPTPLKMPKSLIIAVIFVGSFLLSVQFLRMAYGYMKSWTTATDKKE